MAEPQPNDRRHAAADATFARGLEHRRPADSPMTSSNWFSVSPRYP